MNIKEMTTCPSCNGRRTSMVMVDGYRNGKRFGETRELACMTCDGRGSITAEHLERIAQGRRLREDRISRGLSLRDEAKRLGIHPAELSDRENGRLRSLEDAFRELGKEGM